MKFSPLSALVLAATLLVAASSHAIPALQIYIEGATYDNDTETWITGDKDLVLWVIGNVGQKGPILDVKLTAAFLTSESGSIHVTGTNTGQVIDPSVSADPGAPYISGDGEVPVMSTGQPLPSHGTYGPGVSFMQWELGDMTLTDSQIGDFGGGYPTSFPQVGQINAYNINISSGLSYIRFDTFNHVESNNSVLFGPFSHDGAVVPEPGTVGLFGVGLVGAALTRLRKKKTRH